MQKPGVKALPRATEVAVAYVRDGIHARKAFAVPAALGARIAPLLEQRNLVARPIAEAAYLQRFAELRDTSRRLRHLLAQPAIGRAPLVLLVETQAGFYSHLSGRYRWNVQAKVTFVDRQDPQHPYSRSMDLAAVLSFDHQREDDALMAAAPLIARRLASAADGFVAGRTLDGTGTPPTSAPASAPVTKKWAPAADAIYFVLVDRFNNGDERNDGKVDRADPAAWHGGDLAGVLGKLDDLHRLGVRTLWLSPIFATRQAKNHGHGAFHGYWVEDINRLDRRFGDEALLERLVAAAHQRGIRVLLDLVVNHVGYGAKLARDKPEWFHNRGHIEDFDDPAQAVDRDVHGLPDLAQEREPVYRFLVGAAHKWLTTARVDGYRLDAVKHVGLPFWRRFNSELAARHGHRTRGVELLGEHFHGDPWELARVAQQGRFTRLFDFPLAYALRDSFCKGAPPGRIGAVLTDDRAYSPRPAADLLVTFLDNHDMARITSLCGGDLDKVRAALTAQLALRGTPSLTYGIEAALSGSKEPENRGDMRFDRQPLRQHIARLLRLRREHPVLVGGQTSVLDLGPRWLVVVRQYPNQPEVALLLVNTGDKPRRFALPRGVSQPRDALVGAEVQAPALVVAGRETRLLLARADRALIASDTREVRLSVRAKGPGSLLVVGGGRELGQWQPGRGLALQLRGKTWRGRVRLPVGGVFAFKLARRSGAGTRWEQGANRYLRVAPGAGPLGLELTWRAKE